MGREPAERRRNPSRGSGAASDRLPRRADGIFRREGEYWTIVFQGDLIRLRDVKGLRYIARLLGQPGERLAPRELIAPADGEGTRSSDSEHARMAVTKRIKESLKKIRVNHPSLGEHLAANIKTGRLCMYAPHPSHRVSWRL